MFVILPNQLFDISFLDKTEKYVLYEHPHFFTRMNFNKKKLLLHRASMREYYKYLKRHNVKCTYVNFKGNIKSCRKMFDPVEKIRVGAQLIESPNFLLRRQDYEEYKSKSSNFFFAGFYKFCKQKLNLLPNVKSTDKCNRNKMDDIEIPRQPHYDVSKYKKYIEDNFPDNLGNCDSDFYYPITHKQAKKHLSFFIKNKLDNFGKYQDSIDVKNGFIFHSVLSAAINIGLLNPLFVAKKICRAKTHMNNKEAFIRQLIWREFQRYCYIYIEYEKYKLSEGIKIPNIFYLANTGIDPVDDAIRFGIETGYMHHILRLMVVGNYMKLIGVRPEDGYKWFMEFSCDSYDWVMHQNVYDMVFYVSKKTTWKNYIASGNYIMKMSNYKRGPWYDELKILYHQFIDQ